MTSRGRWTIVAVVAMFFAVLPYLASLLPAGHSSISAAAMLAKIQLSADVPFSGYAQAEGTLGIPAEDGFDDLATLLGGSSNLRVWWRAADDWRVDQVTLAGESDITRNAGGIWLWDYESEHVSHIASSAAPAARLLRADDLAPGSLARRVLAQATGSQVTRIGNERVAGRSVPGIEPIPRQPQSTIARVEVWALPSSGLPVKVEVFGKSSDTTVVSSRMLDLSTATPSAGSTQFTPPPEASVDTSPLIDVVAALNRFVRAAPPTHLAGLARDQSGVASGSVGLYGQGVTDLVALPLPARFAYDIAADIDPTATNYTQAESLATGPLSVRLTAPDDAGSRWLLAGTVTAATLAAADRELPPIRNSGP